MIKAVRAIGVSIGKGFLRAEDHKGASLSKGKWKKGVEDPGSTQTLTL